MLHSTFSQKCESLQDAATYREHIMNQLNDLKTKKRTLILVVSLIAVFTLTAGCGNNANNNKPSNSVNGKVSNEGAANKKLAAAAILDEQNLTYLRKHQ